MNKYVNMITKPAPEARGRTRWWWYGCAVNKAEIIRELDCMLAANMGGVELQILYPIVSDDPNKDQYNISYNSPEFFEILAFTAQECHKRGLIFDFTPGSSWPFGAPSTTLEDSMQSVIPYIIDVQGPTSFTYDFTTRFTGTVVGATMGQMDGCTMRQETVQDITSHVTTKYLFGWPWGEELSPIEIPEGTWKLVFFVVYMHRNHVGKPSRNAQGLVIDHCSRPALSAFWESMVHPMAEKVPFIHSFFCDSIEVEGHNWSGLLKEEFQKRRGYDLTPYIYALWGELGDITADIRYDYFLTMSELTIENFFDHFTDLCHMEGATSRIQAHGTWGDILKAYAAADIPEGETFGDHTDLKVNTIHRRLAASAGHLYGKNIISNETFTWLVKPRFRETPQVLKAAVDAVFADGINAIVNHGYAYSPSACGPLGQPFYASCHINHNLPWWPQYKYLGAYIQRVSDFLRQGLPHVEVGIYLPQMDIWADNPLSDLHMAMKLEEHIGIETADNIQKAGYWFDYLNDEAIIKGVSYKAILLIGCTRLPVATAQALEQFVAKGGLLIAAENYPTLSAGLMNMDNNYSMVKHIMEDTFQLPNAQIAADKNIALLTLLQESLKPDVKIQAFEKVGYVHRIEAQNHIYFLTNICPENTLTEIFFRDRQDGFILLCPQDGTVLPSPRAIYDEEGCHLYYDFAPYRSLFVIFSPDFEKSVPAEPSIACIKTNKRELHNWRLTVNNQTYNTEDAMGWETVLPYYTGTGVYETSINMDCISGPIILDLGQVSCTATVWVNDTLCTELWLPPFEVDITKALCIGQNHIRVQVASPLINTALDPDQEPGQEPVLLENWPYFGNVINNQRYDKFTFTPERDSLLKSQPAGLLGPVYLWTGE